MSVLGRSEQASQSVSLTSILAISKFTCHVRQQSHCLRLLCSHSVYLFAPLKVLPVYNLYTGLNFEGAKRYSRPGISLLGGNHPLASPPPGSTPSPAPASGIATTSTLAARGHFRPPARRAFFRCIVAEYGDYQETTQETINANVGWGV